MLIEISVILARAKSPVLLLNKEEWRGLQQLRFLNLASLEISSMNSLHASISFGFMG